MATRVQLDDPLDKEIENIIRIWKNNGIKNIKKPDIIRLMLKKYKEDMVIPHRKPKTKTWQI